MLRPRFFASARIASMILARSASETGPPSSHSTIEFSYRSKSGLLPPRRYASPWALIARPSTVIQSVPRVILILRTLPLIDDSLSPCGGIYRGDLGDTRVVR